MVYIGVCPGLLGKGPAALVLRHTCLRKAVTAELRGRDLGRLGSQFWLCAAFLKLVGDEGQGKEMAPTSSFYPREGVRFCYSQESPPIRANYFPSCILSIFSDRCFHIVFLHVACLPWAAQHTLRSILVRPADFSKSKLQRPGMVRTCAGLLVEGLIVLGLVQESTG